MTTFFVNHSNRYVYVVFSVQVLKYMPKTTFKPSKVEIWLKCTYKITDMGWRFERENANFLKYIE